VAARIDGRLSAYGFVLDQSAVIDEFGLEAIDFGKFKIYQRKLAEIAEMTGVVLADVLNSADVMLGNESRAIESAERVVHARAR
jgi:hypothetical protein